MPKHSKTKREESRRLFLTGEATTVAEIARRLKIKPHTVGLWRREEDWDGLRLKIDRRAAEKLVEELASERVTLNAQHFKMWGLVVSKLFESLQAPQGPFDIRQLDKVAAILDKAQRGQRLARGLALDGQTEEQIRAELAAENRDLIDLFVSVVRAEVPDETLRDRIARAILDRTPTADSSEDEEKTA